MLIGVSAKVSLKCVLNRHSRVGAVTAYVPRLIDDELRDVLDSHPAALIVGPRACGKTTTARRVCRSLLRLDVPAQAAVVRADPDAALRGLTEPILIDEWQLVPEILGAIKRAVDDDSRPGRFVLTGSSAADLTAAGWPATGRVVRLVMGPLVGRERHGRWSTDSSPMASRH
jgi:predicted AAA+ superfamily ATPase